jgi:hypothetical protein
MDIVFTDPEISRFLEGDPATQLVTREAYLQGFECYVVEQWACSRTDATLTINTYSGDPSHRIRVSVLKIPTDNSQLGPRWTLYFRHLYQFNAKSRETPLGHIMLTNLSTFPSSLTVIPVQDGDIQAHKDAFFVNENLKRLHCSGRVALTLSPPSDATAAKFYQLYRVSKKVKLNEAVIELVKMCQIALMLFRKLDQAYVDGLLCDMTEKALTDWWVEFGADHYNIEPHDGILGPTTVAALIGMLIGARNRLDVYGAPVAHDVFNVESTKRGIAFFQKAHHLDKSRRLDRQTLTKLHQATARAASGEGWLTPHAVMSTVAELSGRRANMVMEMMGHQQNKPGIAEIETVDLDKFVRLVRGSTAKWMWRGKKKPQNSLSLIRTHSDPNIISQEPGTIPKSSAREDLETKPESPPSTAPSSSSRVSTTNVDYVSDARSEMNVTKPDGLYRSQSFSDFEEAKEKRNLAYWPRRLSFSLAEEGLSTWASILRQFQGDESGVLPSSRNIEQSRRLRRGLRELETDVTQWVQSGISEMDTIDLQLSRDLEYLQGLVMARREEYEELRRGSKELTTRSLEEMLEFLSELDDLKALLDYELNVVEGQVKDMQAEVTNYEEQVRAVERMVDDLEREVQAVQSWTGWIARLLRHAWGN